VVASRRGSLETGTRPTSVPAAAQARAGTAKERTGPSTLTSTG
jgi:hypothetical protein